MSSATQSGPSSAAAPCPHITALVLSPAGDPELRHILPDLATLQGLVGGAIEPIRLPYRALLYVHEEGKYAGLPPNRWANLLARHLDAGLAPEDTIVGTAVAVGTVTGAGEYDGEEHDVPVETIEAGREIGMRIRDLRHGKECPATQ